MRTIAHFFSRQRVATTWSLGIGVVLLLIPTSLVLSQGGGRAADAAPAVGSAASMTWQSVLDRSNLHWNNIEFVGRNVAYAAGGDTWDGPYTVPATYAKSTDGGVNWTTKSLPTGAWMRGLACKDANTCWTVGQGGKIHKTTDGGNTWVQLTIPSYSTWMYAVALTGVGDGLVVGLTGEIARSTNGTTFTLLDPPGYSVKGDFSCPTAGLCYAASKLGRIYKSTDNGATWSMITTGTGKWLWGIDCTSSNACWVVGDGGEIWYTNNGFQSLQRQQTTIPSATIFKRVDMVDAQHGYVVGEGGVIYRTDNGSTWQQMPGFHHWTIWKTCLSTPWMMYSWRTGMGRSGMVSPRQPQHRPSPVQPRPPPPRPIPRRRLGRLRIPRRQPRHQRQPPRALARQHPRRQPRRRLRLPQPRRPRRPKHPRSCPDRRLSLAVFTKIATRI